MGWNPQGELAFTGRTETTSELGVREGGLVTTLSLPTSTDRDIRVRGVRGVPGINTNPPPPTSTDRDSGVANSEVREGA